MAKKMKKMGMNLMKAAKKLVKKPQPNQHTRKR